MRPQIGPFRSRRGVRRSGSVAVGNLSVLTRGDLPQNNLFVFNRPPTAYRVGYLFTDTSFVTRRKHRSRVIPLKP